MSTGEQQEPTLEECSANVLMEVSNTMVRLYKDHFGRGPTSARTHWAGSDALVCILEDTFTPAERNLARMGAHDRLRDTRLFFQYATVAKLGAPVEHITGRKLKGFHSSIDTETHGQAVELLLLHPAGYDGPSRLELAGRRSALPSAGTLRPCRSTWA